MSYKPDDSVDPWAQAPTHKERVLAALSAHKPRQKFGPAKVQGPGFGFGQIAGSELGVKAKKPRQQDQLKRSIEKMRSDGYVCERTEHWNSHAGVKNDLFGVFDFIAIGNSEVVLGQVTSKANKAARERKIRTAEVFPAAKQAGVRIVLHLWDKEGPRMVWVCKVVEM